MRARRSANDVRSAIARTVRRAPEVVITITSRKNSGRGMAYIRAHLDYITRNGEIDLEDREGSIWRGKQDVREFAGWWQQSGAGGSSIAEVERHQEAINLVFTMPAGTDPIALKDAVRQFAANEFGDNYEYAFALHTDSPHPHVHLDILTRGRDGKRLYPRPHFQRWREEFAQELREHGIDANATSRQVRGQHKRYARQADYHRRRRTGLPQRPSRVDLAMARKAHAEPLQAWRAVAIALAESDEPNDRRLSIEITRFVTAMPIIKAQQVGTGSVREPDELPDDRPKKRTLTPEQQTAILQFVERWHRAIDQMAARDPYASRAELEAKLKQINHTAAQQIDALRNYAFVREHEAGLNQARRTKTPDRGDFDMTR